jgi:hypothetical protein
LRRPSNFAATICATILAALLLARYAASQNIPTSRAGASDKNIPRSGQSQADPSPALSQTLAPKPVNLLGGRLAIRIPIEARLEARPASLMGAKSSADEESRIVLDHGPERMVMMAYETFSRASSTFEAAVQKKMSSTSKKVEAWHVRRPLRGVAYWPTTTTRTAEANVVMGLYVMRTDRTVQHCVFYINPAATQHLEAWENLARRMAASVTEGQKSLMSQAGERRIGGFVATVPEG